MCGHFSSIDSKFSEFLGSVAKDRRNNKVFTARNFLLDEGITENRAKNYVDASVSSDLPSVSKWSENHTCYLKESVFLPIPPSGLPTCIDPSDYSLCPETFRYVEENPDFLHSGGELLLLRVESLKKIIFTVDPKISITEFKKLAFSVIEGDMPNPAHEEIDTILKIWSSKKDVRPIFAGFWEDLECLFGDSPSSDPPGWADDLRDRLGLAFFDPAISGGPIDILVFLYPVKIVPRLRGSPSKCHPLVRPTVLDSTFFEPFCPAPRCSNYGYAVDLAGNCSMSRREILHPSALFRANHLFRLGTIRRSLTLELEDARGYHILDIRERTGRINYASDTDGDIV